MNMSKLNKFIDVTGVIALRKVELFNRMWKQIEDKFVEDQDKEEKKTVIIDIISKLDNDMFIGKHEKVTKQIDPNLSINKLHLDEKKIINQIEYKLKRLSSRAS